MQRLHRSVSGLLVDGVIKPRRGVLGVEKLGLFEFGRDQDSTFLLEIGFA